MIRNLIGLGIQVPLTGLRIAGKAAGKAIEVGQWGLENTADMLEIGRTVVHQAPLLARLCKIVGEHPETVERLAKAADQDGETLVELLEIVLKNPKLGAFMKELGDDPERFNKLLEMGSTVSGKDFPIELARSTGQNADTLLALLSNPKMVRFLKTVADNPEQLDKLTELTELVTQGANPFQLLKAYRRKP